MDSRTYVIINTSDLTLLDYSQLLTTSIETTIRSVDGDKAIVKYNGDMPPTIESLSNKTLYNHDEIIVIVESSEWRSEPSPP
tara:strand:+ start:1071 stop:1316 length:246 start_codon:yes stop_codon:yes gene_type:complete